jgi:hypothetical protein
MARRVTGTFEFTRNSATSFSGPSSIDILLKGPLEKMFSKIFFAADIARRTGGLPAPADYCVAMNLTMRSAN